MQRGGGRRAARAGRAYHPVRRPGGFHSSLKGKESDFMKVKYDAKRKMIIYRNLKNQLPLPERFRCKMYTYVQSLQTAAVATNFYSCAWNSNLPFNGSGLIAGTPAIATLKPAGFSLLCINTCYQRYRVHGAKIKVNVSPQSVGDNVIVNIVPVAVLDATDENPTTAIPQPFSKRRFFNCNSNDDRWLSCSSTVSKITGYPGNALENDMSGTYEALYNAAPATPLYFVISWKTNDQANLANALPVSVLLEQDIEFFGLNAAALPNT